MFHRTTPVLVTGAWLLLLAGPLEAQEQGARGRNKRIFVVPRPGPVVIDGKLDDWDLSGQILVYVAPETSEMQSIRIALMYDDQALYVSGVVRDPTPLMDRHDPKVDGKRGFTARATYDAQNLYVSYDVESPFELVNSIPDPHILFKGGNLLDIQLATDPGADPKRTKPA